MLSPMKSDLILPSFAKINLILRVLGKRTDGYHEIFTVFQAVSLHDELAFSHSSDISIVCSDRSIPTGESNLIYRAVQALKRYSGKDGGVRVTLTKNIPSPGGLGGGSSNAAVALIGTARLWELEVSVEELARIGGEIGADVPFFFFGGTAVGTGTGTEVESLPDISSDKILIVSPKIEVSTAQAYRAMSARDLTKKSLNRILKNYRKEAEALYKGHFELLNDFETVIFDSYPEIKNTADILKDSGANAVSLSGSGPSVFGFFEDTVGLEAAQSRFREFENVVCFPVRTISSKTYRDRLGLVPG